MVHLAWISGLILTLASIQLHLARVTYPDPNRVGFDAPILAAFVQVFAWGGLVIILLLAVQIAGIIGPLTVATVTATVFWRVRKHIRVYALYRFTPVLAALGLATTLPLWQAIYGQTEIDLRAILPRAGAPQ